jgi:hypothetical protein
MADEPIIDAAELVADLKTRAEKERAEGGYADADELAALVLEVPPQAPSVLAEGFDLGGASPRVRFRPELGFSGKPLVGPLITGIKKLNIRLLFFVLDDLARQVDAAVTRVEAALAAEIAEREATAERQAQALRAASDEREMLEQELRALSARIAAVEERAKRAPDAPS